MCDFAIEKLRPVPATSALFGPCPSFFGAAPAAPLRRGTVSPAAQFLSLLLRVLEAFSALLSSLLWLGRFAVAIQPSFFGLGLPVLELAGRLGVAIHCGFPEFLNACVVGGGALFPERPFPVVLLPTDGKHRFAYPALAGGRLSFQLAFAKG
jgi:hypothetical protein